jgi:hypothetical protein
MRNVWISGYLLAIASPLWRNYTDVGFSLHVPWKPLGIWKYSSTILEFGTRWRLSGQLQALATLLQVWILWNREKSLSLREMNPGCLARRTFVYFNVSYNKFYTNLLVFFQQIALLCWRPKLHWYTCWVVLSFTPLQRHSYHYGLQKAWKWPLRVISGVVSSFENQPPMLHLMSTSN